MTELRLEHKFDPKRFRHYLGGKVSVLHCHHYATLYSQTAEDADEMFGGIKYLVETSRDVFYGFLSDYIKSQKITDVNDRAKVVEDYWSFAGMGKLKITKKEESAGEAEMNHSHVDEGWIKKWGKRDKPVNFITQGYLAGGFAAIFDKPANYFRVKEAQSIVTGAPKLLFTITAA